MVGLLAGRRHEAGNRSNECVVMSDHRDQTELVQIAAETAGLKQDGNFTSSRPW